MGIKRKIDPKESRGLHWGELCMRLKKQMKDKEYVEYSHQSLTQKGKIMNQAI